MLAHEHRDARRLGRPPPAGRWDERDGALAAFGAAAARRGLALALIDAEPPVGEISGRWRRWTADISIFEVQRQTAKTVELEAERV